FACGDGRGPANAVASGAPRGVNWSLNMAKTKLSKIAARVLLAMALAVHICFAQDWPQWRGLNRDGVVPAFTAPKIWPDKLKTIWNAPAGMGYSAPVIAGRRVYLLSRQQDSEVASCLDLDTGKLLWRDGYPTPYTMNPAAVSHGKGPKS